ncbi:hypothetical protein HYT53_05155 [Candidatus Woesearchaeota archaeon]|nr:hypothetical protein [Candidatus Woesearchaeota archaeon]
MDEKEILKKLSHHLTREGYPHISINPFLKTLGWSFDLYAESKNNAVAIEYRKNDNVPKIFFDRVASIKGQKRILKIYLLFEKTPKASAFKSLKEAGIGIIIFQKQRFYIFLESKDFSKRPISKSKAKKSIKKIKSMPQIWVYPCSKQYESDEKTLCKERDKICKIVRRYQRKQIPIGYKLVENDKKDDKYFKKQIIRNLRESHIFIAAINERYSEYIDFEISNVFDIIKDKMLILIMKKDMSENDIEEKELDTEQRNIKRAKQIKLIKFAQDKTKTISYSGLREFEEKVDTFLVKMIVRLHEKNKVKSPFSY